MNNKLVGFFVLISFIGCANNKKISYSPPVFEKQYRVKSTIINDSSVYSHAWNMLVYDSLLLLVDVNLEDNIYIFNRNTGTFLKSIGKKGAGPGELVNPENFTLDNVNGVLYVNDYDRKKILQYYLGNIMNEMQPTYNEIQLGGDVLNCSRINYLKDSFFVSNGFKDRLLVLSPSKIELINKNVQHLPQLNADNEWYRYLSKYSTSLAKPDGKKYVTVTSLGAIMEIFSISEDKIELENTDYFYEPIFDLKNGSVLPNEQTIGGFAYLSVTDNYIYATIFGTVNPVKRPHIIWKFDWKGNPIASYETEHEIVCFTIDEASEQVYASVYKDGEQVLAKIDLKDATEVQKE